MERISEKAEGLQMRCCKRMPFCLRELVTSLAVRSAEEVVLSLSGLLLYMSPSTPAPGQVATSIAEIVVLGAAASASALYGKDERT
jgi:hypothetical protein